jgi:hypothetical protein
MNKTSGQSCVKKVKHQVFGDGGSMSILSIQLSLDPRCHDVSTRQVCLKVELNIGGGYTSSQISSSWTLRALKLFLDWID